MARPNLAEENEIECFLSDNPQWIRENNTIVRELVAANFVAAIGIVNSIALLSEKLDHHPDILIYGYNKIRIITKTHDKDGLTSLDFELARQIDDLVF